MKFMNRGALLALLLLAAAGAPLVQPSRPPDPPPLILDRITIIDATGAPPQPDMAVEIRDGRITRIGKSGTVAHTANARVIAAEGKYLIPGLWDMHLHVLEKRRFQKAFAQLLASGITGIRDMGTPVAELGDLRQLRERVESGELPGPRFVASGPMVDGAAPMFPRMSVAAADATEGREAVRLLKQGDADFIKVYTLLTRQAYFAIADEARRQGLDFAGHVPDAVGAGEASDAGQKSIEHLSGVLLACSTEEDRLRAVLTEARGQSDAGALYDALRLVQTEGAKTYSRDKAAALFARFARNRTWQTPTLVGIWNPHLKKTARDASIPRATRRLAYQMSAPACCLDTPAPNLFAPDDMPRIAEMVKAMRDAGVPFLAGTDAPNFWAQPGVSLHEELALFVELGFTPLEALQAATRNPALYLGLSDALGTVEEGKFADLILLDADPLEDIDNTRRIAAVILRGNYWSREDLAELAAEVAVTP